MAEDSDFDLVDEREKGYLEALDEVEFELRDRVRLYEALKREDQKAPITNEAVLVLEGLSKVLLVLDDILDWLGKLRRDEL